MHAKYKTPSVINEIIIKKCADGTEGYFDMREGESRYTGKADETRWVVVKLNGKWL
jgi:hypothetical protein